MVVIHADTIPLDTLQRLLNRTLIQIITSLISSIKLIAVMSSYSLELSKYGYTLGELTE